MLPQTQPATQSTLTKYDINKAFCVHVSFTCLRAPCPYLRVPFVRAYPAPSCTCLAHACACVVCARLCNACSLCVQYIQVKLGLCRAKSSSRGCHRITTSYTRTLLHTHTHTHTGNPHAHTRTRVTSKTHAHANATIACYDSLQLTNSTQEAKGKEYRANGQDKIMHAYGLKSTPIAQGLVSEINAKHAYGPRSTTIAQGLVYDINAAHGQNKIMHAYGLRTTPITQGLVIHINAEHVYGPSSTHIAQGLVYDRDTNAY